MASWAGLRNILVHMYLEIDHDRVVAIVRDELDDLVQFAASMAAATERD